MLNFCSILLICGLTLSPIHSKGSDFSFKLLLLLLRSLCSVDGALIVDPCTVNSSQSNTGGMALIGIKQPYV